MRWLLAILTLTLACGGAATEPPADAAADAEIDATGADSSDAPADSGTDAPDTAAGPAETAPFQTRDPQRLVVLNYNVMCSGLCSFDADEHPGWISDWAVRLPMLRDVIRRHDPDLIALQELQELLPTHPTRNQPQQIVGPEDAYDFELYHHQPGDLLEFDYDDATVFWRKARFAKKASGVFWLSSTPDVPFQSDFGNFNPRMVVWVLLHDKTNGRDFYFANTHFDNTHPSQDKSAPLVLERLGPLAGQHPLIFAGDFNSKPASKAYGLLTTGPGFHFQNAFDLAGTKDVFSNVAPPPFPLAEQEAIDHVFLAGADFDVAWWVLDLWRYGATQQAPSDHDGAIVTSVHW